MIKRILVPATGTETDLISLRTALTIAREDLTRQVLRVEDEGGWSLIFSLDTSIIQVEERCSELARIARKRWEAMQRWASRRIASP